MAFSVLDVCYAFDKQLSIMMVYVSNIYIYIRVNNISMVVYEYYKASVSKVYKSSIWIWLAEDHFSRRKRDLHKRQDVRCETADGRPCQDEEKVVGQNLVATNLSLSDVFPSLFGGNQRKKTGFEPRSNRFVEQFSTT